MVCAVTEHQTHGHGRRGRRWSAEPNSALLTSIGITLAHNFSHLSHLSLMVATFLTDAINCTNPQRPIGIKWPNDLYLNQKKLGGILIDATPCDDGHYIVIGIGMNLTPQTVAHTASLSEHFSPIPTRAWLLSQCLTCVHRLQTGAFDFKTYQARYAELDLTRNQSIMVHSANDDWLDVSCGVDSQGYLRTQKGHTLKPHTHSIRLNHASSMDKRSLT